MTCPKCGREQPDKDVFCRFCGGKLPPPPAPEKDGEQTGPKERQRQFCSACGAKLRENAGFCSACGEAVTQNTQWEKTGGGPKAGAKGEELITVLRPRWLRCGGALLAIVALIIAIAAAARPDGPYGVYGCNAEGEGREYFHYMEFKRDGSWEGGIGAPQYEGSMLYERYDTSSGLFTYKDCQGVINVQRSNGEKLEEAIPFIYDPDREVIATSYRVYTRDFTEHKFISDSDYSLGSYDYY